MNPISNQEEKRFAGKTLLLVEDIPINHRIVEKTCEALGWAFLQAFSSEEGEKLALENKVDIILMDYNLNSELNGAQLTKKIRDVKPHILIFSYSSGRVEDEEYKGASLWNGHLGKNGEKSHVIKLVFPHLK
ncbi:MAG: response regulator [Chlamydiia bacterium]|nr:response regulator [Chlamydiia bacterium]